MPWQLALAALSLWLPQFLALGIELADQRPIFDIIVLEGVVAVLTLAWFSRPVWLWGGTTFLMVALYLLFLIAGTDTRDDQMLWAAAIGLASVVVGLVMMTRPAVLQWRKDRGTTRRLTMWAGFILLVTVVEFGVLTRIGLTRAATDRESWKPSFEAHHAPVDEGERNAAALWREAAALVTTSDDDDQTAMRWVPGAEDAWDLERANAYLESNRAALGKAMEASALAQADFYEGSDEELCAVGPLDDAGWTPEIRALDLLKPLKVLAFECKAALHQHDVERAGRAMSALAAFSRHRGRQANLLGAAQASAVETMVSSCLSAGLRHAAWEPTVEEMSFLMDRFNHIVASGPTGDAMVAGELAYARFCSAVAGLAPWLKWDKDQLRSQRRWSPGGINPWVALHTDYTARLERYWERRAFFVPQQSEHCYWKDDDVDDPYFLLAKFSMLFEDEAREYDVAFLINHRRRVGTTVTRAGLAAYAFLARERRAPRELAELAVDLREPCAKDGTIGMFVEGKELRFASAPFPSSTEGAQRRHRDFVVRNFVAQR
ncbi:MAG: hypothetical protein AB2A00_31870 [Myxococcota bacterium]